MYTKIVKQNQFSSHSFEIPRKRHCVIIHMHIPNVNSQKPRIGHLYLIRVHILNCGFIFNALSYFERFFTLDCIKGHLQCIILQYVLTECHQETLIPKS